MSETLFLKKYIYIFHSFKTYKNKSDFSVIKDNLFYHHKTDLNFYFQKLPFLNTTKQIWYFDKSKSIFLPIKTNLNFFKTKEETSFINKFV